MKLKTLMLFLKGGVFLTLLRSARLLPSYYRVIWLAAGARHGLLRTLAEGPKPLDALALEMAPDPKHRDALEAWLGLGVRLREIACDAGGYRLSGFLAGKLSREEMDALAAVLEEAADLHHKLILDTPARLKEGRCWSFDEQDGALIARSSRITEPIGFEALDEVIDKNLPQRLLEVGAGSGIYIRYAAEQNPRLTALGLERQADVATMANENLDKWGLKDRAHVELRDVRQHESSPEFDIVTLQNNIYYFPVDERVELFRHLRSFLKPGGKLLVTTACRGGTATTQVLDIWSSGTEGCGRLPTTGELETQLMQAGFARVRKRNPIPGESYCAFVATHSG